VCFDFLYYLSETFLILRRTERDMRKAGPSETLLTVYMVLRKISVF